MAARLTNRQADTVRASIKATMLVRRLQQFAMDEKGDQGETIEIDAVKLRAIEILLRKCVPDLSAVEHSGDSENPVAAQILVKYGLDGPPTA